MSLVANIRKCRKMGTCNPKSKSTVTSKAYKDMQSGWKKRES